MQIRQWGEQLYFFLLYTLAFVIPFPYIFASVVTVLLFICWLLTIRKENFEILKIRKPLWFWIIFFLLHCISYFYSTDKEQSLFDLQTKLSFLILPFVIGTGPIIDRSRLQGVVTAFIFGLSTIALFCLVRGGYVLVNTGSGEMLFYHALVTGLSANAVYMSLYVFFGISVLLLFQWQNNAFLKSAWRHLLTLLLLFTFFVLLSSKMLLALMVLSLMYVAYIRVVKQRKPIIISAIAALLCVLSVLMVVFTDNPIKKRYTELSKNNEVTVTSPPVDTVVKPQQFNNLSLRLFIWKMAVQGVHESDLWLTGTGNGDAKIEQEKQMKEYNERTHLLEGHPPLWEFNIHNMYLQTLLMLGIPGLVTFLFMVFQPLIFLKRLNNVASSFWLFFISIALFMFQESALQTQAGILYFTFFSMIFYNYYYSTKHIDTLKKTTA